MNGKILIYLPIRSSQLPPTQTPIPWPESSQLSTSSEHVHLPSRQTVAVRDPEKQSSYDPH